MNRVNFVVTVNLLIALAALGLVGCDSETDEPRVIEDAPFCVLGPTDEHPSYGAPQTATIEADGPLRVHVLFDACGAGGCQVVTEATCTTTVGEGNIITVASKAVVDTVPADSCTADCRAVEASCVTDALPAGTYTIVSADEALTQEVPFGGEMLCTEGLDPI